MTDAIPTCSIWRRLCHTRLRDVLRGRLDASLDWRQTIEQAELPGEIAEAVRQVVGRTRLWRSEKVDVAAELVAHFQDGRAAGRSPDDLLQSFGEPQAAAQLIRRAKKRGRPMLWHAWHYGWIGVVTLLLSYVTIGFWMSIGRPTIRIDYIAAVNKSALAVPENERAWPVYRDALLAMGFNHTEANTPALSFLENDAKPGDAGWKQKEKFLSEHAESIAKLREAAGRRGLAFVTSTSHADFAAADRELFGIKLTPQQIEAAKHETLEDRWVIGALLPDMQYLRYAGFLLGADARRAASAGDSKTAYADVIAMLGISRHCEELPFLVCLLVGERVQREARSVIRDVLSDQPALWTNLQLRDLAHQLAASQINWRRGFEGERTCIYDSMQRVYTDDGHGDGRLALHVGGLAANGIREMNLFQLIESVATEGRSQASVFANAGIALLTLPAANMAIAHRKEMVEMYDRITDRALARLGTPYWVWASEPSLDEEVSSLKSGPIGQFRYLFVVMLTPSYDTFLNGVVVSNAELDGAYLGLALELYHREHKKWPDSLAELSPQYLPTLPLDPITGKPLQYKVVKDRPLVYSVGVDGDDDGGRLSKSSDGQLRPENAEPKHDRNRPTLQASETDGDWVLWTTAKRE